MLAEPNPFALAALTVIQFESDTAFQLQCD